MKIKGNLNGLEFDFDGDAEEFIMILREMKELKGIENTDEGMIGLPYSPYYYGGVVPLNDQK